MDSTGLGARTDVNILREQFKARCLNGPEVSGKALDGPSVIIVGAGAFGTALALELVTHHKEKYARVEVFDKWPVPSRDAASTDTTKIIRADYTSEIYAKIAGEAIELWKTDFYKGTYFQTGWICLWGETDPSCSKTLHTLRTTGLADGIVEFKSGEQVRNMFEMLDGPMDRHVGYFNPACGWANSAEATYRVATAAQQGGAIFHTGASGHVTTLIYDQTGTQVTGIKTKSGSAFYADKIVLCTGAWTNYLIDTKGQLIPKGHCLGHIRLTPEERVRYATIPVVVDQVWNVYYFPPFSENGVMKIATVSSGYLAKDGPRTQSDHPEDGIPTEAEEHLRRGIKHSIPALADKEMFDVRVCWCVDTPDSHLLITPHPDVANLYLATGGSHHGFKFLPCIGHYIAMMLEGKLVPELADTWKWRPGLTWSEDVEGEAILPVKDFKELKGWELSARHGVMAHTWGN